MKPLELVVWQPLETVETVIGSCGVSAPAPAYHEHISINFQSEVHVMKILHSKFTCGGSTTDVVASSGVGRVCSVFPLAQSRKSLRIPNIFMMANLAHSHGI